MYRISFIPLRERALAHQTVTDADLPSVSEASPREKNYDRKISSESSKSVDEAVHPLSINSSL